MLLLLRDLQLSWFVNKFRLQWPVLKMLESRFGHPCELVSNLTKSRTWIKSLGKQANKHPLFITLEKFFFLTSGLLGVDLAKSQWHTTKICLRREATNGVIKSESSVFQLTILQKRLGITWKNRSGQVLNTTTYRLQAALHALTTGHGLFLTLCSLTWVVKLFLQETPRKESLKRILIFCCKGKKSLLVAQA